MKKLIRFFKDEEGAESVEYALIVGLLVVGLVIIVVALRTQIIATIQKIIDELAKV
ncbi:MAG: hypothetical protein L6244_04555 [Candidatus Methanoperedenaceae archaeon]|nr:hypothetical protein [Candidatus Methanoperedenaceae archaeon]